MGEQPLLIRRDAQRKLSLAIFFFLAIPSFVLGFATFISSVIQVIPGDCFRENCPTARSYEVPPFVAPAAIGLAMLAVAALALYLFTYRGPRVAWVLVAGVGVTLELVALGIDLAFGLRWEVALVTFVWPMAPGLMAIDAGRIGLRERAIAAPRTS